MCGNILNKTLNALGKGTGWFIPRPRNLLVVPRRVELAPTEDLVAYGLEVGDILFGCGGTIALHRSRGGNCLLLLGSPLTNRDRRAIGELGLGTDSTYQWSHSEPPSLPAGASVFYPFPPGRVGLEIMEQMEQIPRSRGYFYESKFLILPDTEICVDDACKAKLRAMTVLKPQRDPLLSHALAIYRSAATGRGAGWYESFISLRIMYAAGLSPAELGGPHGDCLVP